MKTTLPPLKPVQLLLALSTLALFSCASNQNTRIEKNPELFQTLPEEEKEQVNRGEISNGMSKSAVYLALGKPDRKTVSNDGGATTERWDYSSLKPVFRQGFYGHFGSGFGRGSRGFGRSSFGYSPRIHYVPVPSSYVKFTNDRVSGWQKTSR